MPQVTAPRHLDQALLDMLYERWAERKLPILNHLRPGLIDAQIDELTAPLGITMPEEARVWWRWHDGAELNPNRNFKGDFGPNHYYMPLGQCVQMCARGRDGLAFDRENPDTWYWVSGWFPFTTVGTLTLIDTGVSRDDPVPVRAYFPQDGEPYPIGLPSIGMLIEAYIDAMDRGVWIWLDDQQRLGYDFDKVTPEDEQLGLLID
jgi:hypothetical protein